MNQRPNCCRPMPPQAPCPSRPPCPPKPACPACPPTQKGVLLPRILASGREWQRRACVALYVGGLPEDVNGRLRLVGVTACGDADWEIAPYQEPRPCGCRGCRPSRPAPCLLRGEYSDCLPSAGGVRASFARRKCADDGCCAADSLCAGGMLAQPDDGAAVCSAD